MKLLFGVISFLSTAASLPAMPHPLTLASCNRELTADQISSTINVYMSDVRQVNNVYDNHRADEPTSSLIPAIQLAQMLETSEQAQLRLLATICDPTDADNGENYAGAINAVANSTSSVLGTLGQIILNGQKDGDHVAQIQDGLDTINIIRCCTILPTLDSVFELAAGMFFDITDEFPGGIAAPRPSICSQVVAESCEA